jgi:predicted tellurium resistance membrane protein TerC
MAVRSLAATKRRQGIIIGAGVAVALRVVLTFFAAKLLTMSGIKFFGGLLIIWIAIKLFMEGAPQDKFQKVATTLRQAIVTIMIADLVVSTDNILAVAGASKGKLFLLILVSGLASPLLFLQATSSPPLWINILLLYTLGQAFWGR